VTPQHGPSWDEDRAWSAFAPDPEPRHLAELPLGQRLYRWFNRLDDAAQLSACVVAVWLLVVIWPASDPDAPDWLVALAVVPVMAWACVVVPLALVHRLLARRYR